MDTVTQINIGRGASCSAITGDIIVKIRAATLQNPKTDDANIVGMRPTLARQTVLKDAATPNLAIVTYNGIIETSFG